MRSVDLTSRTNPDPVFSTKVNDIEDLAKRLLRHLMEGGGSAPLRIAGEGQEYSPPPLLGEHNAELRLDPAVPSLADRVLARERGRGTTTASGFAPEAAEILRGYLWPGNARELRSVVERAAILVPAGEVPPSALPPQLAEQPATLWAGRDRRPTLKDVEQAYIRWVLDAVGGSQTRAAAVLGISRKALWEKRRRYGIG